MEWTPHWHGSHSQCQKKLAPTKRLTSFFAKASGIVVHKSPDAGPLSHSAEPARLSSTLSVHPIPTPGLFSVVCDGVDQELESTQLGLALEITVMDPEKKKFAK